jgi:hypothetical protein
VFDKRFTMQEEADGTWSVVDAENGARATVRQRTLASLAESEARDAVDLLNMIAGIRVQKRKRSVATQQGVQSFLLPVR